MYVKNSFSFRQLLEQKTKLKTPAQPPLNFNSVHNGITEIHPPAKTFTVRMYNIFDIAGLRKVMMQLYRLQIVLHLLCTCN